MNPLNSYPGQLSNWSPPSSVLAAPAAEGERPRRQLAPNLFACAKMTAVTEPTNHRGRLVCEDAVGAFPRFDDLRNGIGTVFDERSRPVRTIVARRTEEVLQVLGAVEAAASNGCWAVGFVAYEAAPGLEPTLTVRSGPSVALPPEPAGGFVDLPMAWFALFDRPRSVAPLQPGVTAPPDYSVGPWRPETTPVDYVRKLEVVRSHIREGNTYQCNLTAPPALEAERQHLFSLFTGDISLAQQGAYNAYLDTGRSRRCEHFARAVLRVARRGGHRQAHEGHGADADVALDEDDRQGSRELADL